MPITLYEATKLNTFRNFRLVSGVGGLDNPVGKVGILDWEFFSRQEGQFVHGEFVLTSLLFAKDHPEYIFEAVKDLILDGASGLAVKNIYYNEMPQEVISLSNEKRFPIFIFDNSAYFEDIITEVNDRIRFADSFELMEAKVELLVHKKLDKSTVKEIAFEINNQFEDKHFVIYLKSRKYLHDQQIMGWIESAKKHKLFNKNKSLIKFQNGLLLVITVQELFELNKMIRSECLTFEALGVDVSEFQVGISNVHESINDLDYAIKEALYAFRISQLNQVPQLNYSEIGIYQILLPYIEEHWMHTFAKQIIDPILKYDEQYHSDLLSTAIIYVNHYGSAQKSAEALFVHKNTVRYRITKIAEILGLVEEEGYFYEQLSVAIKLYQLNSDNNL